VVSSIEPLEEPREIVGGNADAPIPNCNLDPVCSLDGGDAEPLLGRAVFEGVVDEIAEHLFDLGLLPVTGEWYIGKPNLEAFALIWIEAAHDAVQAFCKRARGRPKAEHSCLDAGSIEQFVQHARDGPGLGVDLDQTLREVIDYQMSLQAAVTG